MRASLQHIDATFESPALSGVDWTQCLFRPLLVHLLPDVPLPAAYVLCPDELSRCTKSPMQRNSRRPAGTSNWDVRRNWCVVSCE